MTEKRVSAKTLAKEIERKDVLLRAAYDLLTRNRVRYIEPAKDTPVFYNGCDYDGHFLREDIAIELDLEDNTNPLPLLADEEVRI
jgi:hypothetical protein